MTSFLNHPSCHNAAVSAHAYEKHSGTFRTKMAPIGERSVNMSATGVDDDDSESKNLW